MKLRDLNAELVDITASGVRHQGTNAVVFDCPCGAGHRLLIPIHPPIGGVSLTATRPDRAWDRTGGDTVDDLSLSPSIAVRSADGECWHGWIRDGRAVSC